MRESGILMHITSLPGPYGIGTMGKEAYAFVDFLEAAGQGYWQLLPLNPTSFGDSPYQSTSTCAGNPYLIDLDLLVKEGLLTKKELDEVRWCDTENRVNYGTLYVERYKVLKLAHSRFLPGADYDTFFRENESWLSEYALFMALKEKNGGAAWLDWPEGERLHDDALLASLKPTLEDTISFHCFLQYQFYTQWNALRSYAAGKGIRIIGDVPIYVPTDSVEVWADPQLFQLDENRHPRVVAGCPPDGFTEDGQLWGNPIYDWDAMEKTNYQWWVNRLSAASKMYDTVRIDHFRGFESYWEIPAGDKTARNGRWVKGPGKNFVRTIQQALPDLDFIAEDLGFVTDEVRELLDFSGYPGMKLIQFAFDSREESDYLPHLYPVNSVCYTGTHDNTTVKQWLTDTYEEDLALAKAYLGLSHEEGYIWGLLRGGMASVSKLFIAQMQDYLELGSESRMNIPGLLSTENWSWRATEGFDSPALAAKIRNMVKIFGRLPKR